MSDPCCRQIPADAEYVLRLLLEDYELQQKLIPSRYTPDAVNKDTTILDWFIERDFEDLRPSEVIRTLDRVLNVNLDEKTWTRELQTARNLSQLAQLLSLYVKKTELVPLRIAGAECTKAAAFLTVRERLQQAGLDVSEVTPSTPIESFLKKYPEEMLYGLIDLIPNLHVWLETQTEWTSAFEEWRQFGTHWAYALIIALPTLLVLLFGSHPGIMISCAFLVVILLIHLGIPIRMTCMTFRDIHTFRDLSERIAAMQSVAWRNSFTTPAD